MRVGIITLGCDKNTVDNEYVAGLLAEAGCEVTPLSWDEAPEFPLDAAIITTCGFIHSAKQQSVDSIAALAEQKREQGNPKRLFVAGCLAQRYAEELLHEIPEIDGLVGVGQFDQLARMVLGGEDGHVDAHRPSPVVDIYRLIRRRRIEQTPHAFLKISDGCNHACTFCSIPSMKGKLRSVPPEILLDEARGLLDQGVRELNLVAQDLADYGRDRWKDYRLPELLRDLAALDGDFWLRCLYVYPGGITDRFLEVLASEPKIVPYLDMPLQHLDTETLHRMKRPHREVNTVQLVRRLREALPNLTLRTTMIVGFPGETPQAHQRMLDLVEELRFDRLGVFQYSREEDTPAAAMPRQVGKQVREKRWHAVMERQAEISARLNERRMGRHERVLVEAYDADQRLWVGRSGAEAPEIDGNIFFSAPGYLRVGDFVHVEITEPDVYDLYGRQSVPQAVS
ncbi:MAG: 30S ribosomal protein S12 methylthiotransferase RimO [Candidatus Hydrogenedentes bacterium]|nr:30S ribosomal protein S12 methylthiotransferase RimO [Candidatus Hydrogenedentota bacterium]